MSKYGVISGPYFSVFGLNMDQWNCEGAYQHIYFAKLVALYPNNWNQKIIYHKCFEIYQTCYKNVSGIVNLLW